MKRRQSPATDLPTLMKLVKTLEHQMAQEPPYEDAPGYAAIYIRTAVTMPYHTAKEQEQRCRDTLMSMTNPPTDIQVYIDDSATVNEHPALDRLAAHADLGKVSMVIVHDDTRLGRESQAARLVKAWQEANIGYYVAIDDYYRGP